MAMTFKMDGEPTLIAKHGDGTVEIFREDLPSSGPKIFCEDDFEALCRWFLVRRGLSVRRESRRKAKKEATP